jgi:hypothetical protein
MALGVRDFQREFYSSFNGRRGLVGWKRPEERLSISLF